MPFKITARTILQLGAELISSDAIAFYELIKNAFDAGSKRVEVRIVKRLERKTLKNALSILEEIDDDDNWEDLLSNTKNFVLDNIISDSFKVESFIDRINNAYTTSDLNKVLKKANYILIRDWGEGMSLEDLREIYLTIGTRNRRIQKENLKEGDKPILGEKGLGRLSVMRLGESLYIETTRKGEPRFNVLDIDWTRFSNDSDELLEDIDIEPVSGKEKTDVGEEGTKIFIYDLREDWTEEELINISADQLTRFVDPFQRKNRDFIRLWFNNEPIVIPNIDQDLFKYAHAVVKANLKFDDRGLPIFSGEVNYRLYKREKQFSLSGIHLVSTLALVSLDDIRSLGPFDIIFYWYNRPLLTLKNGVPDAKYIKKLVEHWAGGLMVFRDGFRVNPYGGLNDDWLKLDPEALSSPGYKLNRKQIVGKVDISTINNPKLLDQTNREGLRDNPEKKALVRILQHLIWSEVRTFLDSVKKEYDKNTAVESLVEIERRILVGHKQVRAAVDQLKYKYPVIQTEHKLLSTIEEVLDESSKLFKQAKLSSEELKSRIKTTLDLAGLGLMVDVIAHELNRSTKHALKTIDEIPQQKTVEIEPIIETLRSQLQTLQARLKVIDPLGPSGRQRKELTDIKKIVTETVASHKAQFIRHDIECYLEDTGNSDDWTINAVPGMIVQIIENLISNSVYWLNKQKIMTPDFKANITIVMDRKNREIIITDNGPGIPKSRKDDVFQPFFTTKPPGDGKGLGLYISQEIAKYHDGDFYLLDLPDKDYLNTFVLSLKKPNTL